MNGRIYPPELFQRELERYIKGRSRSIVFSISPKTGDLILVQDVHLNAEFSAIFIDTQHLLTPKGIVGTYLTGPSLGEDQTENIDLVAHKILSEAEDEEDT